MKNLSIGTAWNETIAIVKRDAGLLFTLAVALMALPTIMLQVLAPQPLQGQSFEPGAWMLLVVPVMLLNLLGGLTITMLTLDRENIVGQALAAAARRIPSLLGALLLLALGAGLLAVPIALLGLLLGGGRSSTLLTGLLLVIVMIFFWARLILMTPVAAAEPVGPIGIVKRSWKLTAGHVLPLIGVLVGMTLVFLVVTMAISSVVGIVVILLLGQPQPGNLPAVVLLLIGGLLNTVFIAFFTTMMARIYVQLSGGSNGI